MGAAEESFPRAAAGIGAAGGRGSFVDPGDREAAPPAGGFPHSDAVFHDGAGADPPATGRVLRIQRLSTEDGPGLRTTAFLKGCGLACAWCHNPESLSFAPQVQWLGAGCLACGICVEACPRGASALGPEGVSIDRSKCSGCGVCAEECPSGAMEILGTDRNAENLVAELEKDRSYFETSGGGITLSGGEASLQPDFSLEILRLAKRRGLSTALDTCGFVPWEVLERLLAPTDIVLYDLKFMDPDAHRRHTGADNRRILENVLRISAGMRERRAGRLEGDWPSVLWIRTPIVPGATDSEENIRGIGEFIADELRGTVGRWELCAFNNLCADKYARLGMPWDYENVPLVKRGVMVRLASAAKDGIGDDDLVVWTGAVRD